MRRHIVQYRSNSDNTGRIHRLVTGIIVVADMVEVDRLGHPRHLVDFARVRPQVRVVDDTRAIALEMPMIHRIEAEQRHEGAGFTFQVHQSGFERMPLQVF